MANWDFTLQCSMNLSATNWFDVGSTPGADALQTIPDSEATNAMRSYRVLMVPSAGP
jgi:hypothetical protein